jgi:nucleotide-binding universal stress UspA family protein
VASDRHATVIVAGSRGRGGLASTILGSVSSGLVHNAETPVLVVRPES